MPNLKPIILIEGLFVLFVGLLMAVPAFVDWQHANPDWKVFTAGSGTAVFVGGAMILSTWGTSLQISVRQGFFLTTTSWLIIAAVAALPFTFAEIGVDFTDAFFEAMSGLTTTGSTVLSGLDNMPPGILLWRSILQWFGGIGIIVTAVAMLPFLGVGGMQLFRMESSDKSDKILPRAGQIAGTISFVYVALTVLCGLAYWMADMTPFEAVNHAMTTLSTGGFSTSDQSMGHFQNPAVHWIGTAFMVLGGLPFVLYVSALHGRWRDLVFNSQVRAFVFFLVMIIMVLATWLSATKLVPIIDALRLVAFNVVSVVTTTGYASTDYSLWGAFPIMAFFFLTFVGGCTGSTSGGIKVFRFEIMVYIIQRQAHRIIFPHGVFPVMYNGRQLTDDVRQSLSLFVFTFVSITALMTLALSLMGLDFMTSFSGAATAIANVGPGLGNTIGPAGNFASLPDGAKWVLSFGMLVGRLEIITVLVLLTPWFWRG